MKYSIVYSSRTGNTAKLAQRLRSHLPPQDCLFFGNPQAEAAEAELIFVGFWTDKGGSDSDTAAFLNTLRGKQVFLFGTAGFGGSDAYFAQILQRVQPCLDSSNTLTGAYMCQGRMPESVRRRYEAMLPQDPEKMQALIHNFDSALSHPDENDLVGLDQAVTPLFPL